MIACDSDITLWLAGSAPFYTSVPVEKMDAPQRLATVNLSYRCSVKPDMNGAKSHCHVRDESHLVMPAVVSAFNQWFTSEGEVSEAFFRFLQQASL